MKPRILVPYDFSPAAERALAWAGDLQRTTGGSVRVVHVMSTFPGAVAAATAPMPLPYPSETDLADAERALRDATSRLAPGATVEATIASTIDGGVLEAVRANRPDLVVMGTHGRGGFKRMMLGSVADHLVRNAECPVVTMREQP
jgi:nucleotide-binding universal stress UspA family protein